MRYNLKFHKLTLYGLIRPQSIRKSKQIYGQTILSSPQDLEFNPNFAKNRDIPVVKSSVTRPVTPARHASVNDRYTLNILFNVDHMPNSSIQSILHLSIPYILFRRVILFGYNIQCGISQKLAFLSDVEDRDQRKHIKQVQWWVLLN